MTLRGFLAQKSREGADKDYERACVAHEAAMQVLEHAINLFLACKQAGEVDQYIAVFDSKGYRPRVVQRLKSFTAVYEKVYAGLVREEELFTLCDIAGVRVICRYLSQVYYVYHALVRDYLASTGQFRILDDTVKDYIEDPKGSGYRSLQLVIEVSVATPDAVRSVPCELQLRTEIQDTWSEMEHGLFYKNRRLRAVEDAEKSALKETMGNAMDILHSVDEVLDDIRSEVGRVADAVD